MSKYSIDFENPILQFPPPNKKNFYSNLAIL